MPKTAVKIKKDQGMTLGDVLVVKLRTLYDIENQLAKALPKFAKSAKDEDLKHCFEAHARQAEKHVQRLEQIFEVVGVRPQKLESEAVLGMISDTEWIAKNVKGDTAVDVSLAAAGQAIKQYEIAGYEAAVTWARMLEQDDVVSLLQEALDEESESSAEFAELTDAQADEMTPGLEGESEEEDDEG